MRVSIAKRFVCETMPDSIARVALLSISAFCLHSLLLRHHVSACQSSFFGMFFADSAYCRSLDHILHALQWVPIALAAPVLDLARRPTPR